MPDRLVVDASAAIAIDRAEPTAAAIRTILADHVAAGGEIVVPGHFWLEFVNVVMRRYRLTPEDVVGAIRELDEFGIVTVEIDRPLLMLCLGSIATAGLSAYDATYLALAEALGGRLLTLDSRLAAAAGDRAIPGPWLPRHRSAEAQAAYSPLGLSAFGPYLAELRRRAEAIA
ncbi:MAG: type II toxin-antitoxin system VapC family toxin [Candidatus Limnocylindrales bacterium]